MEFPHPSLMQTQLSAKGQSIERKSHAEAYGVVHRFDSPHKRRVTHFHHTAWDAIQLGQLNHHLRKEYDEVYKEFKQDKKKPEEERKYYDYYGRWIRKKRATASKRERKQESKVAQVVNDVDYHVQHGTMTEKDRQYIHNTINRSRSPAFREEDHKRLPLPVEDK